MRFKRAKVDANHSQVVAAFRALGFYVKSLASIGQGFPDLHIAKRVRGEPRSALIEVKDGSLPPSKRRLTPQELEFHQTYPGEVYVVATIADVGMVSAYFFT